MSDDEDGQCEEDISVIRKAIEISGNMIEQILKGIHYGSPEVRCLLYSECDYILECKVCRNLFRSLPNFVAHKRSYCTLAFQQSDTFMNLIQPDEETIIVQPEAPEDSVTMTRSHPRTLETTVQQLKDGTLGHSSAYKLYSQAADKMEQQREYRKTQTLTFEPIPNTTQAMKVTVTDGVPEESDVQAVDTAESMEIDNISNSSRSTTPMQSSPTATLKSMLLKSALEGSPSPSASVKANPNTVLSPPKKMTLRCKEGLDSMPWKKSRKEDQESSSPENGMDFKTLECLECNTAFRSKKTLVIHYQNAHCGKRTFFPCPYCKSVFFYIFGLTRHLMRGHNKSKTQIDKMRDKLKKNSFVKEVTSHCQSARQQILHVKPGAQGQGDSKAGESTANCMTTKPDMMKSEIADIIQSPFYSSPVKESDHICSNCGRSFGKKINLLNHRKICLTQGCTPITTTALTSTTTATFKQKSESQTLVTINKGQAEVRRPLTKTTGRTKKGFRPRHANPRCDINELLHSGFSSSVEEEPDDSENAKENSEVLDEKEGIVPQSGERYLGLKYRNSLGRYRTETQLARDKEIVERKHAKKNGMEVKNEEGTEAIEDELNQEITKKSGSVEEIWVDKQPGRPTEKIKSNRTYVMKSSAHQILECQDTKKVREIVNENELHCIHCNQEFSNVSNLRRHAIRHLGWKRYKCKMCKFSSYNKSECNTHLFRTHSDRFRNVSSVNSLIVDLGKEGSRVRLRKKQQTLIEKHAAEEALGADCYFQEKSIKKSRKPDSTEQRKVSPSPKKSSSTKEERGPEVTRFNISTRNSPREFDIRPYRKVDRMTTLCTRKSSYPKKITVNSFCHNESDDDETKSTISHTSKSSEISFTSAKSKMDISDTDSEIIIMNKNKITDQRDNQIRRSARTVNDNGKLSPLKTTSVANDEGVLKASRNLTPDLMG